MARGLVASPEGTKRARKILKAKNLTQQRFAEEVGLSYTTINNFLNGKPVDRLNFEEICNFLDLNWKEIAIFNEEPDSITQLWQKLQAIGSPTEKMGLVLTKTETLSWSKKPHNNNYEKTVRLGSYIRFEINFDTSGHLLLLQKDTIGNICCFCPSCFASQPHLSTGKTILPQEGAPMKSFLIEGEPGTEQILAILTQEPPTLHWLPQPTDDPLDLEETHLKQLIDYINQHKNHQILYTNYTVTP